jgi:hypothetical protein
MVLLAAAYFDFRQTRHGHRYRTPVIVGSALLVSVILGTGLHAAGVGHRADMMLAEKMPRYREAVVRGAQLWNEPEDGRLMGRVEAVVSESDFEVNDVEGERWKVRIRSRMSAPEVIEGMPIRAIGEAVGDNEFEAEHILPWRPKGLMRSRHLQRGIIHAAEAYNRQERSKRPQVHPAAGNRLNNPDL